MTTKIKALLAVLTLLLAFLLGFVPASAAKRQLRSDLKAAEMRIMSLEHESSLAEVRDLAGLMLVEALRRNYGSASAYSSKYFDKVRELDLAELLQSRDEITATLAQGNPSAVSSIQTLVEKSFAVTRH